MNKKINLHKNFTMHAGLKLYDDLWRKYNLSHIFDTTIDKHSGANVSNIMQNLFSRNLIDANSMTALEEKDKEEYFLKKNACLNRTTYGRNLKKINDRQRKNLLLRFNNEFLKHEEIDKDALMIYDTTAIKAEGKTYENTKWVYDGCEEKMIIGYALNKLLLQTKNKLIVVDFELQNEDKNKTIGMFKRGRRLYGVNKVVIDAGRDVKSVDFYKKLDEEDLLFYTKATKSWYFNYGKDYTVEQLREIIMPRLKKEHIISLEVWKGDMLFRLIFVLGDPRIFLTNDLEINAATIVSYYKRRWKIETSFKEEKQNLGLGILPSRSIDGIKTHILLVLLAYVLSQRMLIKRKVKRITEGIKLIKRKIVNVFALVVERYNQMSFEFDTSYRYSWVFSLKF